MKKNSAVEDIFQNDNSNKNKTKTILLLTIVAIILISVFLIIAWVMTRDNPVQTIGDANNLPDVVMLNERSQDSAPQTIPYAHNIDSDAQSNLLANNTDQLGLNLDTTTQGFDSVMSPVPPVGVQPPATNPVNATNTSESKDNYEDDKRYQAALRDLEQKHNAKGGVENASLIGTNENSKPIDNKSSAEGALQTASKPTTQEKVVAPLVPKEAPITALSDTKNTQDNKQDNKDVKQEATKPVQTEAKDSKKSTEQPAKQVDNAKTKESPKVSESEKPKPKVEDPKPQAQAEKPKPQANDKVIQRSPSVVDANQGKAPEKGHYIQVGSFAAQDQDKMKKPFLNQISKYSYRKLDVKGSDGSVTVKYLIGPYKTREEAKQIETKIRTEINSGAFHYEVK